MLGNIEPAIQVNDLKLKLRSFGESVPVFNGLQLSVPTGSIYGLIGPSGCGKTTFFRCILGRYKPDSGSLIVLGSKPGSLESSVPGIGVGYMPQDIALDEDLTVHETLYFYGRLNDLSPLIIKNRSVDFKEIIGVDDTSKRVCQLSIGTQRRLSLVCALLHRPPLVILDEPTVGSDPVLVKKIWDYLVKAQNNWNMTIIVSTHYLEEVKRADYFAFLNKGFVVFEDNPKNFIAKCNQASLEDAILYFYKQETLKTKKINQNNNLCSDELQNCSHPIKSRPNNHVKCEQSTSISSVNTINASSNSQQKGKSLSFYHRLSCLLWRYQARWKKHMIWRLIGTGIVHAMIITFCGLLYGHFPQDQRVGIVNYDLTGNFSRDFLSVLQDNPNNWIFENFKDEDDARFEIERGHLTAYLRIGPKFSDNLEQKLKYGISTELNLETISSGSLTLVQDTVNKFKAEAVTIAATVSLFRIVNGSTRNGTVVPSQMNWIAIEPVYPISDQLKFLAPTNITLVKFFFQLIETVSIGMIVLWVTREFHEATIERLTASGITQFDLSFALILITVLYFSPILIGSCVLLTLTTEFPIHGAWNYVSLVIPAIVAAGSIKAIWIGSLVSSSILACCLTTSYGFIGIFTGSIFWPLEGLPYFMVPLRHIYPYTESGLSGIRAMVYGDSFKNYSVYGGVIYTWLQAIVMFILITFWFKVIRPN